MMEHNELCIYYFFPWKGLPYSFCLWKITFLKNLCKHLLPVFCSSLFLDWSQNGVKVGPELGANSLLFSRYLLTQTGFHHDLQMNWRKSTGPLWGPQCYLTCNPSHSALHLWLMLVFTWYIWRAGTPITANTTNKGAHHGLLWCPAPLSNIAGLRKSVQKEEARACTCPLNPFKWYFTDKPKSAIHLVLTCGKCSSQTLPKLSLMLKDWQKIYNSGKKKLSTGERQLQKEDGSFMAYFPLQPRFKI